MPDSTPKAISAIGNGGLRGRAGGTVNSGCLYPRPSLDEELVLWVWQQHSGMYSTSNSRSEGFWFSQGNETWSPLCRAHGCGLRPKASRMEGVALRSTALSPCPTVVPMAPLLWTFLPRGGGASQRCQPHPLGASTEETTSQNKRTRLGTQAKSTKGAEQASSKGTRERRKREGGESIPHGLAERRLERKGTECPVGITQAAWAIWGHLLHGATKIIKTEKSI